MPNNKNSRKRKGKGAPGAKLGQLDDGQGAVAIRQSKRQATIGKATSPVTPALSDTTPSCSWYDFKACSPLLAAPLSCSTIGCTAAVHLICQAIWENKNNVTENFGSLFCPRHHPAMSNTALLVKTVSSTMTPLSTVAVVAPVALSSKATMVDSAAIAVLVETEPLSSVVASDDNQDKSATLQSTKKAKSMAALAKLKTKKKRQQLQMTQQWQQQWVRRYHHQPW